MNKAFFCDFIFGNFGRPPEINLSPLGLIACPPGSLFGAHLRNLCRKLFPIFSASPLLFDNGFVLAFAPLAYQYVRIVNYYWHVTLPILQF